MEDSLFKKIISEIPYDWGIRILLYLNSEPFLDPMLVSRLSYINEHLPDTGVEIATNMSLVGSEIRSLVQQSVYLKEWKMSVFGFTPSTYKKLMPGLKWEQVRQNIDSFVVDKEIRSRIGQVSLVMIDCDDITPEDLDLARSFCKEHFVKFEYWGFLDRAGNVPQRSNNVFHPKVSGCEQHRPIEQMHIMHTGEVILCCQDWKWTHRLGDLKQNTLTEIWHSESFQKAREDVYQRNEYHPLCSHCKLAILG